MALGRCGREAGVSKEGATTIAVTALAVALYLALLARRRSRGWRPVTVHERIVMLNEVKHLGHESQVAIAA